MQWRDECDLRESHRIAGQLTVKFYPAPNIA